MELISLTSHAMFSNGEPKLKRPALGWRLSLCEQAGRWRLEGPRSLPHLPSSQLSPLHATLHPLLSVLCQEGLGESYSKIPNKQNWLPACEFSQLMCAFRFKVMYKDQQKGRYMVLWNLFSKQYQISSNHAPPSLADLCICWDEKKSCQNSMFQDQLTPG